MARAAAFWSPRLAIGIVAGLTMLAPVLTRAGWPYNHDGLRALLRMAQTAGQWHDGHLLPIWSNAAQFGYGSPGVLLYNKLFSYGGALVRLVVPGPKFQLCLTLLALMVGNVLGVGLALRIAAGRSHLAIEALCGIVAISCNYAFTDWLTRGAVAEFSAYCVLPWLFAWCFTWLRRGRPTLWIGPLMWLLWMAHSAIATFVWVLLGPCVVVALIVHGTGGVLRAVPRLAAAVLIFVAMALPFVLAAVPMIAWAQVTNMIRVWRPETTHLPVLRIFHDQAWDWSGPWFGFTPQLDPLLLMALAALVPTVALSRAQRPAASLCLATAACALALQLRVALPIYRAVPGFEYIAFTWRLLTFVSMSLAIGLGVVLLALEPVRRPRTAMPALLCALLVVALVGKPRRPAPQTPWFPPSELALAQRGIPSSLASVEFPEYLPRTLDGQPGHSRDFWQAALGAGVCQERLIEDQMLEVSRAHLRNVCAPGKPAALPEFLAPGMRVTADGQPLAVWRTCDDARVRFVAPRAAIVVLHMPTLGRAWHDWWVRGPAYAVCPSS